MDNTENVTGVGKLEGYGQEASAEHIEEAAQVRSVEYKTPVWDQINLSFIDPVYGKIKARENLANTVQNAIDPALKENLSEEWYNAYKTASTAVKTANEANARIIDPTYGITKDIETSINKYQNAQQPANQNEVTSINQVSCGQTIVIDGKTYEIGYIEENDGTKTTLYRVKNSASVYYAGSDGKLHPAYNYNSHDMVVGGTLKSPKFSGNETWDTSDNDKKILEPNIAVIEENQTSGEEEKDDTQYTTIPGGTRIPVRDVETSLSNIEYYLNRELNVKRKRYYFTYYDTDTITKGPYDAVDMRDLAKQTFKMTPGQGKGADYNSELIEGCIGSVRNILEDVIKYAQDAVIINGNNPGLQLAKEYESKLDEVVPPIYRKFADKCLPKAFAYSNNKQKESNANKKKEVLKIKQRTYNMYKDNFNEDELASLWSRMKTPEENINEDLDKIYKAYRTGHENTQSKPAVLSSLPVGTSEPVAVDDMSVHIGKTDIIIDDLKLALNNYVKGALDLIDYQVSQLNAIPSFTSVVGTLRAEDVNSTLIELRSKLRSLREKYIGWREQAINVSQNELIETPVNPTPSPTPGPSSWPSNGGGGTTGSTSPPTTSPTTPKTEVPIDNRTTEPPVVQPRIDDATNNGGTNGGSSNGGSNGGGTPVNGNSHGGDYSPYGGYSGGTSNESSSTEVPSEVPDVIKEGNSYTLPTSTKPVQPTTPTTSKGNSAIPVLAGLAAAAAAGIGAKAYIDRKKNRNNDEESEEFKAEDWSGNNEINIEYQEPKTTEAETLDDDYDFEEPEKYGARSNQELEDLQ